MPFGPTAFGDVSIMWDNPERGGAQTNTKTGGAACVFGVATTVMSPGMIVIHDANTDYGYATTASANSTAGAGYFVATLRNGSGGTWDYDSNAAIGDVVLIRKSGRVKAIASTAISRGARVGTSTTAGRVVTTTTQDAAMGRAVTAATLAGDAIYVDIPY